MKLFKVVNDTWWQYGLVTATHYQLCVRQATCSLSFNVTGVYSKRVWSGHVLSGCSYHRTPAVTTILDKDPLFLGPHWV